MAKVKRLWKKIKDAYRRIPLAPKVTPETLVIFAEWLARLLRK